MAISFKDALARMENSRVVSTRPLIPPQILQEDLPLYVYCLLANFQRDNDSDITSSEEPLELLRQLCKVAYPPRISFGVTMTACWS